MTSIPKILFSLSLISAFLFLAHAHGDGQHIDCKHDTLEFNPEIADVDEDFLATKTRRLASVSVSTKGSSSSSSSSSSTSTSTTSSSSSSSSSSTGSSSSVSTSTSAGVNTSTSSGSTTTNTTNTTTGTTNTTTPTNNTQTNTTTDTTGTTTNPTDSTSGTDTTGTDENTNNSNESTNPTETEDTPDYPADDPEPVSAFPNIRIQPYYNLNAGTDEFKSYVQNELLPPVISTLQGALRLKYPLLTPMKVTQKTLCGITTPEALASTGTGIEADFVLFFSSKEDTESSWVASASSCLVSSGVKRPLVSSVVLNIAAIKPTTIETNPRSHEYNMYVLMHEILHGLGFSQNFFNNYVDSNGNLLKGHVKKIELAGNIRTVLDLPVLTEKLRNYYGCSSLPGAFMEDDGGSGTSGSHWERRFFPFDLLSSGAIHGRRLTEFTLAFMEGTGWYEPDYSYAEPFFFGQGLGCNFIFGNCTEMGADLGQYEEHCLGTGRGCVDTGRGGGFCKTDTCSDGCRFVSPQAEYDCENPNGIYYTPFASKQVYGRGLGSKCFSGNLTTSSGTSSKTTYCFKFNCVGEGTGTSLEVSFGTTKLICAKAGPLTVSGYKGAIDCPDPIKFCNTIGKPYCPRGCTGRGKCVDNQCVCNPGFQGIDCAFRDLSSYTW